MIPWQNIQGFSGAAAVGSIVFVDLALIANAFADNLFPVINLYSQTTTWAIVIALPVLALVYLIGLLSIGAGEAALLCFRLVSRADLAEDIRGLPGLPQIIAARYQQLRQDAEILAGSAIAFGLLAVGSSLYAWRIEGWRRFLSAIVVCAVIFALGSIALAIRRYVAAHLLTSSNSSTAKSGDANERVAGGSKTRPNMRQHASGNPGARRDGEGIE